MSLQVKIDGKVLEVSQVLDRLNELVIENEKLKAEILSLKKPTSIPLLYSKVSFVDKVWEVVRLGAKEDTEDDGSKCVRVTITLSPTLAE